MEIMSITEALAWPAQRVWPVVSDFGALKRWNPAVLDCTLEGEGVGAVRTFATRAATVRERLDSRDDAAMRVSYTILSGSTIKVRDGRLVISVRPLGDNQCALTWTLAGEPDGASLDELRELTERRYRGRVDDLRAYLTAADGAA